MKKSQIFLLVAVAIVALAYFFIPAVNKQITDSVVMLSKFDLNEVYAYLQSFDKTTAACVSFFFDGASKHHGASACVSHHAFKCDDIWLGLGRCAIVELGYGGRCALLLHSTHFRSRRR